MTEEKGNTKPEEEAQAVLTPEFWKSMTTKEALSYWVAIPKKIRIPETQKELAEILDVSQERLCQIKKEDGFNEQVNEYRKIWFKQFTSNIIEALRKSAEKGDHKAAKLFLQYIEDFKETTRQEQTKTERKEFVFVLGEAKWEELRKKLRENIELQGLKYLEHKKVEPEEEADGTEEAEICENINEDRT